MTIEILIDWQQVAATVRRTIGDPMSWSASGQVEGAVDDTDFSWTPAYDSLVEGPREQADFLLTVIEEAFSSGAVDGRYSVSMGGHVPDPEDENSGQRRSLAISFNPIESVTEVT